ncbi:hypothetical protein ACLNGM_00610 [Aureimonas phyllosphaerae]|uniref:hypothetical protein n=1 Tax=Aureimonas phyllosphaerae TaxID=1166078 RepID=UPI003A5BF5B2
MRATLTRLRHVSLDSGAPGIQFVVSKLDDETRHGDPDGPASVCMLSGGSAFDPKNAGILLSFLPDLIHIRDLKRIVTLVKLV